MKERTEYWEIKEIKNALQDYANIKGVSIAEVIRRAVRMFLKKRGYDVDG